MQKTVFGLVKVVIIKALGKEAMSNVPCLEQTAFLLLKKIKAMPVWLKFPLLMLTFLFDISGILSTGRMFQSQPFSRQIRTVEGWQGSGTKLCREFIKFYEKLALFIYYSDVPLRKTQ